MATAASSASSAKESSNVRPLEDVNAPAPATQPAAPTTKPANQGQSVTAAQVNVSDLGTVEIHVNDAALVEVLRMLSLQSQKNIVASKDVRGTITANLYDVTVREALDAILHANGYDYREKGNF
ncbi:MAG: pilQ, partial [Phycisphaerales bacterium]|nr:pilQ [Phycisphaerales bacterium]